MPQHQHHDNRNLYVSTLDEQATALDSAANTTTKLFSDPTQLLASTSEQLGKFNGYRDAVEEFQVQMGGETAHVRRYMRVSQETDFSPYEQQRRYVNHLEEVVAVFKKGNLKLGATLVGVGVLIGLLLVLLVR